MNNVWIVELCKEYEMNQIIGVYSELEKAINNSKSELETVFSTDRGRSIYKGKKYDIKVIKIFEDNYNIRIDFEDPSVVSYNWYINISEYKVC